jgi:hypothetical protein
LEWVAWFRKLLVIQVLLGLPVFALMVHFDARLWMWISLAFGFLMSLWGLRGLRRDAEAEVMRRDASSRPS